MDVKNMLLWALLLLLPPSSECLNIPIKYNQTPHYFLDTNTNIREVIDFTLAIMPGEVTKIEKKFKKDIPIWKINMFASSGGTLTLEVSCRENKLLNLEANEGPFDYDLQPDASLITFSAAKKSAEDLASKHILRWSLKPNKDKLEYNFWLFTKTGKAQVKVDAVTGEIVSKKKKK